jgi:hypothetical protein
MPALNLLALLGGHCEKWRGLLFHILTAAVRTLGILFVVLVQGQSGFEGLVAIEANIIVYGHGNLP